MFFLPFFWVFFCFFLVHTGPYWFILVYTGPYWFLLVFSPPSAVQPDPGRAPRRRPAGRPGRALRGHERRRRRLHLRALHARVPLQGGRVPELPRALRLGALPAAPLGPRLVPGAGPARAAHGRAPRAQGQGGRALPAPAARGGAVPGAVPARGRGAPRDPSPTPR
ncbi:hypothetical protein RLOC_00001496 [Lonchura striata]|uniref:Uncharacterized protein n=1 Tax=Lonchura striata TaxID=40157 RepID=A0A218U8P5_9PASE|nr:hypothetical protein RLOC_00001496 [Lonchura striata domestica]